MFPSTRTSRVDQTEDRGKKCRCRWSVEIFQVVTCSWNKLATIQQLLTGVCVFVCMRAHVCSSRCACGRHSGSRHPLVQSQPPGLRDLLVAWHHCARNPTSPWLEVGWLTRKTCVRVSVCDCVCQCIPVSLCHVSMCPCVTCPCVPAESFVAL